MKVKALSLVFLIVFAAVATSVVLYVSSSQITQEGADLTKSYSIVQVNGGVGVAPNGDPIDTPGGPTHE